MKKAGIAIAVLVFLLSAGPVSAAWSFGDYASSVFNVRKTRRVITPTPTPKRVSKTARVDERTQAVVTRMLNSYQNRLDNYMDFLTKVQARRDKLSEEGKDVTRLDAFIKTAIDNATRAQTVLNSAKTTLGLLDYTSGMPTLRRTIQTELQKIRMAFTNMHKSMSETVRFVRDVTVAPTARPTRTVPARIVPARRGVQQ